MSNSYPLPAEPVGIVRAISLPDHTDIAVRLELEVGLDLPPKVQEHHVFVAGDIARVDLDWSIDGTGPEGKHVHYLGAASDIVRAARRKPAVLIDNNPGTAVR